MATMSVLARDITTRIRAALNTHQMACARHVESVESGEFSSHHDHGGSLNPATILAEEVILCRAAMMACNCANAARVTVDSKLFELIRRLEQA